MRRFRFYRAIAFVLAALVLVSVAYPVTVFATSVRLQDDFYTAVNDQWLRSTSIPADLPSVSGFQELAQSVYAQIRADFDRMDRSDMDCSLGQFLDYCDMASDYTTRNAQAAQPLMAYIERILALESLADLDAQLTEWVLDCMPLPFSIHVSPDMGFAARHALYVSDPGLILPDVTYYNTPVGQELLATFAETGQALLELAGISNSAQILADALAFDALLVPYVESAEVSGNYTQMYNPMDMDAFVAFGGVFDFEHLFQALLHQRPTEVVVMNPKYFAAFGEIVTEANFPKLQHWMLVNAVFHLASYLDQSFLQTASNYQRTLTGIAADPEPSDLAFLLATNIFGGVVGDYYGQIYFGEDARRDVTDMTNVLIETFKQRLMRNDWLSTETIESAIAKLDTLEVNIGYPDQVDPMYDKFQFLAHEDGGTLLDNTMTFAKVARAENFARYSEPVNRRAWNMTAHTVNAQYNPVTHAITFPAALLQAPFYCSDQSVSQNYGGIGAVIAHEITHAFDWNGAQFDASGSLGNWWTETDTAAFELKTKAMIELFDGLPHGNGFLCGRMTVTENTADAGGIGCALEALRSLPEADLVAFFCNWATIWRNVATSSYEDLLLTLDVHAPGKIRANMQLGNLDEFYETFDVTEEDEMYIPESARVVIW